MVHSWLTILFFFLSFFRHASTYTWSFTSQPIQCQNLSIVIQGSGQPPYSLFLLPTGPAPIQNFPEFRPYQTISFTGTSTTLTFDLNYPENSSFVAVVSDSNGFGTGGASTPVTVLPSSNSSCYNPTLGRRLSWGFNVGPPNGIIQCESVRWWWDQDLIVGTAKFYGVIPGGDSFIIPQGTLSTTNDTGTGFSWTVDIFSETYFIIVGGDDRGIAAGGTSGFIIGYSSDGSCLSSTSPSSTAGSPAGGSYPTGISSSPSGSSMQSNAAAIAGGVTGGLVAIVALALIAFFYSRRGKPTISGERPVNVLHDHEDGVSPLDLPYRYEIEPYLVSDPTVGGAVEATFTRDRPLTIADTPRPQTVVGMTSAKNATRESVSLPLRNSVNIIRHDDAGPSEWPASVGERETIELPPAYGNVRSA